MPRFRSLGPAIVSVALFGASALPGSVVAQTTPQTLVIGVDHTDPANQRPDQHRVFEYTDFFSREVAVHSGDTLDFRFAPALFHIIALAANETSARAAYPIAVLDQEDPVLAPSTHFPKIQLGPSGGSIVGGSPSGGGKISPPNDMPLCGLTVAGQGACTFTGANDIENSGGVAGFDPKTGQPAPVDWMVQIAAGQGDYDYFCYIHPGMRGKLHVVAADQATTSQAAIDARSRDQFATDQMQALQTEQAFAKDRSETDASGVTTHHVSVGVSAADNHVAIDEMLPQSISVNRGDQVEFKWRDGHQPHSVTFFTNESDVPAPFGFDCGRKFQSPPPSGPPTPAAAAFSPCVDPADGMPEFVLDPGNALTGTQLTKPQTLVNSGVLIGLDYGVQPTVQTWSVQTTSATQSGPYPYLCTIHDWMHGTIHLGE